MQRLAAPVTGQNTAIGIVGATFCVTALDAGGAAALVTSLFQEALRGIGVPTPAHLASLEVEEDHEEAGARMSDELVRGAEIGRRLGVSRERVRQWATDPKFGFPEPAGRLGAGCTLARRVDEDQVTP